MALVADAQAKERTLRPKSGPFSRAETVDLWDTYCIELVTEYDRLSAAKAAGGANGANPDPGDKLLEPVSRLLNGQSRGKTWEALYEAEQRLAMVRSDAEIKADWTRRKIEAEKLGVTSVEGLRAAFNAEGVQPEMQKALYLKLLDDLHFRYSKRRLDRQKRKDAATWLNNVGITLLLIGVVATILGRLFYGSLAALFWNTHLFYVLWFGFMGAYFSRSVSMRSSLATLDYDLLQIDYSKWSVLQRLIIGGIASLIVYIMIFGNLLSGDLFQSGEFLKEVWGLAVPKAGETFPLAGFFKLLTWSAIAGFSERLLPDQLAKLESSASSKKP